MGENTKIDLAAQVAAVKREIGFRKRAYPRWVGEGRMTQVKADHEIAAMEAVLATVEKAEAGTRLL